jgi:hypothetical protein
LALAEIESDAVRDSFLKTNGIYNPHMGYAEVINPIWKFWLGVLFTGAGVMVVLAAVCTAVASSVTHHDWSFHVVVTVLVFSAVVGVLLLFALLFMRREVPIQQAQFVQYNNSNIAPGSNVGPIIPMANVAPSAAP